MGGTITIHTTGGKELVAAMRTMDRKFVRDINRGAVGKACNVIRDKARANAYSVGLGAVGPSVTPSGKTIIRHGRIPGAINAAVDKGGLVSIGKIYVAPLGLKFGGRSIGGAGGTSHWRFIEFGSIHNTPTPFFRNALNQAAAKAVAEAFRIYREWVDLYNRTK